MTIWDWLSQNWFNLFGSAGIAGLWLAVVELRAEVKARRNANLLTITANHREVWREYLRNPKLARVRDADADIAREPVTDIEEVYVTLVIIHMSSAYHAMNDKLIVELQGLRRDIREFMSLPIPRTVWEKMKHLQNDDFVSFVESCRAGE